MVRCRKRCRLGGRTQPVASIYVNSAVRYLPIIGSIVDGYATIGAIPHYNDPTALLLEENWIARGWTARFVNSRVGILCHVLRRKPTWTTSGGASVRIVAGVADYSATPLGSDDAATGDDQSSVALSCP